ncbi:MAG TPA: chaplin, partial [Candidatus Stackebrandtia faecavium]|nr:chaplin [Candidatus Stackebrandtia faecavium]
ADDMTSVGNNGLGNGSQVLAPIQAPINLCGNSVAVLGVSGAGCDGGSAAQMEAANTGDMTSAGNNGLANGTQAQAPIQAPIDVCGNSVGVLGVSGAGCDGGSAAQMSSTESSTTEAGDMTSAGNNGLLNGTQAQLPIQAPINVCGNSIAILGVSGATCDGGSAAQMSDGTAAEESGLSQTTSGVTTGVSEGVNQTLDQATGALPTDGLAQDQAPAPAENANADTASADADMTATGSDMTSAGNNGLLNGTQVQAPIQVPIDVSGNSIAVLGVSGAMSDGGSAASMS